MEYREITVGMKVIVLKKSTGVPIGVWGKPGNIGIVRKIYDEKIGVGNFSKGGLPAADFLPEDLAIADENEVWWLSNHPEGYPNGT